MEKYTSYSLAQLEAMPTLHEGQYDSLKVNDAETTGYRVWLSRLTTDDGEPVNNKVTIEQLGRDGKWRERAFYGAK